MPGLSIWTLAALLASTASSTTTYWASPSYGKPEPNCFKALTDPLTKATGCDGKAYFDSAGHYAAYDSAYGDIYSTGGVVVVPAVNVLSTIHRICASSISASWKYNDNTIFGIYGGGTNAIKEYVRPNSTLPENGSVTAALAARTVPYCRNPFKISVAKGLIHIVYVGVSYTADVFYGFSEQDSTSQVINNIVNDLSSNVLRQTTNVLTQVGISAGQTVMKTVTFSIVPDSTNWAMIWRRLGGQYDNLEAVIQTVFDTMDQKTLTEMVVSFVFPDDNTVAFMATFTSGKNENTNISGTF